MTKEEFVSFTLEKDDTADEDIAHSLFEIFDKDASGAMDFSEFIMACQVSKVSVWLRQELKEWQYLSVHQSGKSCLQAAFHAAV